jgi:hypothetical protein
LRSLIFSFRADFLLRAFMIAVIWLDMVASL